jgi:hypothetical protein
MDLYWEMRRTVLYAVVDVLAKPWLANGVSDNPLLLAAAASTVARYLFTDAQRVCGASLTELEDTTAISQVQPNILLSTKIFVDTTNVFVVSSSP